MKIEILLRVSVEVDDTKEARAILSHLENEAAKFNCDLEDSGLEDYDSGEVIEEE